MKKFYALATLIIFVSATKLNAQINYGLSAGISHSTLKGDAMSSFDGLADLTNGMITTQPRTGFYAGGFVEIPLGGGFSIQPAVYYTQKGYGLRGNIEGDKLDFLGAGVKADLQSHYIDVPVVFKAEVAKGLQVFAGPQLSYLVKSNVKMDAGLLGVSLFKRTVDVTDNFNKADVALTGGVGYTFDNGFSINASYDHGLSRVDRNSQLQSYNRSFKVGVGFKF